MRISDWSSDVCSSDLARIFTGNSISLSRCWRQWGSRYAIRAGRNLPDKEFRYLRTVIVTAAVYRGFNSQLAPLLLTFRHRAGVQAPVERSEEHTSELQSLMRISYAVFCLKKKKKHIITTQ